MGADEAPGGAVVPIQAGRGREQHPSVVYNRGAMEQRIEQDEHQAAARPVDYRMGRLLAAFGYAFEGVRYLLLTQRNAQIHCLIGACAVALGVVLRIARWEWLVLVLTITIVLAAEGVNTAIEAAVDLTTTTHHPLAKVAKDVAAGTVLLCAISAVVVGCLIFLPHLWPVLMGLLAR